MREVLLLLGAARDAHLRRDGQQQAPVIVGAVVNGDLGDPFHGHPVGPYYVVLPIGVILLILGASNENRRRAQERLRSMRGMR